MVLKEKDPCSRNEGLFLPLLVREAEAYFFFLATFFLAAFFATFFLAAFFAFAIVFNFMFV